MIRSPWLYKHKCSTWYDPNTYYWWLCEGVTESYFAVKKFNSIRIAISSKYVRDSYKVVRRDHKCMEIHTTEGVDAIEDMFGELHEFLHKNMRQGKIYYLSIEGRRLYD